MEEGTGTNLAAQATDMISGYQADIVSVALAVLGIAGVLVGFKWIKSAMSR